MAQAALKSIAGVESEFHNSLETSYRKMSDTTFKALRRQLPVTRTKIDWNKISTYRLAGDLK